MSTQPCVKSPVITTHQSQFNNYLIEFISQMQQVVTEPHHQRFFKKYYKYYRKYVEADQRIEFIKEFVEHVSRYNREISICDEGLFSEEPEYYPGKHIQLLKGLDFKQIWRAESITEKTKESIWKFLKTLYVVGTHVLKETQRFNQLVKAQQEIVGKIVKGLKMEQKIKDEAERLNEEERQRMEAEAFDFSNLTDLFGENNLITQMAIEIAKGWIYPMSN